MFERLFAPEIKSLRDQLERAESENAWLREQITLTASELRSEQKRNLKREDALVQTIVTLKGGPYLPLRFETPRPEMPDDETEYLSPAEKQTLLDRARETLEQTVDADTKITPDLIQQKYQEMLPHAAHYLTN